MGEIILHERAWVEDAIESLRLGRKPMETIGRLARYYYAEGYKRSDIASKVEDFVLKCDPTINIVHWQQAIDMVVRSADKYPLIEIEGVSVYVSELEKIKKIDGLMLQKLMFTMLCLSKYANAISEKNNNWVNQDSRTIFSLANIAITTKRQALMINDLWSAEYIGFSRVVDNVNMNVKIIESDGDVELFVKDFRNLGNQYLMHLGHNYHECQNCGLVVKRTSNAIKFCRDCAADINRQRAKDRYSEPYVA